jgi:methionyl-tRNA formyltransferase
MSNPLRILFAGTPEFAAAHLKALISADFQVVAVYTQPDRPAGRGKKLTPSPVKTLAQHHSLSVEQPLNFNSDEAIAQLHSYQADVMVVVAYGLLLPISVLNAPKYGCINVHASILPRWRGAAPIHRAIEAGDAESGVTIMQMDQGLDTGDMLEIVKLPIAPTETTASLHDKLIEAGTPALLRTLDQIVQGKLAPLPQPEQGVVYAHKIHKSQAQLDWQQPAAVLERRVRAFTPHPRAFTAIGATRIKVCQATVAVVPPTTTRATLPGTVLDVSSSGIIVACKEGALCITQLQMPGKRPVNLSEFLNAHPNMIQPQYMFAGTES